MKQFWEILIYSYRERIRTKGFMYTTVIAVLFIAALMNAPKIMDAFSEGNRTQIAVIDETGKLVPDVKELSELISDYDWALAKPEEETALREKLENQDVVEGIVLIRPETNAPPKVTLVVNRVSDPVLLDLLNQYIQGKHTMNVIQELNLTPDQLAKITSTVTLDVNELSKSFDKSFMPIYFMIIMLYISIGTFCSSVATAVAAEKSSRIMEVLITKVRPLWLLYGKVLGVGLVGLTQMAIILLSSYAVYKVSFDGPFKISSLTVDFSSLTTETIVYFILFYVLGYFFYATLYAAVGSLVSRSEEATQAMMPLQFVVMIGMISAMYSLQSPDNDFAVIGSHIPFLSPFLMFIRIGMSEVPMLQIWSSIAILIVSTVVGCWIAAKIYRVGVLTYGKRPTMKEVIVAAKTYRV